MKATIEFDLNDHEDERKYMVHVHSTQMASAIFDIMNLKKQIEWDIESDEKMSNYKLLDLTFERIGDILNDNQINIDLIS